MRHSSREASDPPPSRDRAGGPFLNRRTTPAGLACLALITFCTLWRVFGGGQWLAVGVAVGAALLIAAERNRIPRTLLLTAALLSCASVLLLPFAAEPLQATARGVFLGGLLLSLMASVALLGHCALRSAHVRSVGDYLHAQPGSRRYLGFTVASQVFSSMLSLAGANVLFGMLSKEHASPPGDEGLASAITRGFSAATFWSPMFGNMAILLAIYPSLRWIDVFPLGLVLAQFAILIGVLLHLRQPRPVTVPTVSAPARPHIGRALLPLLSALGLFLAWLLTASAAFHVSVTAMIVLSAPIAAWVMNTSMAPRGARRAVDGARAVAEDVANLPTLAPEATVLMAAGCAGTILASAFPQRWAMLVGSGLSATPIFAISALILAPMVMALMGIHPVLTSVFLASTFSPQLLDLPPVVHFCAILTGWGLAACLTPFSVLSLTASRFTGISPPRVSIAANWRFAVWCTALFTLVLAGLAESL